MSSMIERPIIDYKLGELPFDEDQGNVTIQDPSKVRVLFSHQKYPVDIGCLAYTKREPKGKSSIDRTITLVDPDTFMSERLPAIERILEEIFTQLIVGQTRTITICSVIRYFTYFMNWCDSSGYSSVLSNDEAAQQAVKAYISYLEHRVRTDDLHINTAALYQNYACDLLGAALATDKVELIRGVRKLKSSQTATNTTVPPEDHRVHKVLSICECLFESISDFILGEKAYPFKLKLPKESVWVLPASKWMATKAQLKKRSEWSRPAWVWNYEEGRVNTPEEIDKKYRTKRNAKNLIKKTTNTLHKANSDLRHSSRLQLAQLAHNAFINLFCSRTGMNLTPLIELEWNGFYEIERTSVLFRTIKFRTGAGTSGGTEIGVPIPVEFVRSFKTFLKLREYLLGGRECPFLFLSFGHNRSGLPKQVVRHALTCLYHIIRRHIDPKIENITSSEWRVYASEYYVNHHGIETAAMMMQNQPETVLKHYTTGTESQAGAEFSDFFNKLHEKVNSRVIAADKTSDYTPSFIGGCSEPNQPTPETSLILAVTPDCQEPAGCLFCEKYRAHSDDTDIRKLCSAAYVIKEMRPLAKSETHFNEVFSSVLGRIDEILGIIKNRSKPLSKLVDKVKQDVEENENLDHYWETKLEMLVEVGVL